MISFFKKLKFYKLKAKSYQLNKGMTRSVFTQGHPEYSRGMTYVELIVVLSIFSVMTSIVLFNYGTFQSRVNIKILANDIALKIVEAQKYSVSGRWNLDASSNWKPSYGIYFNLTNNKSFTYFADLNNNEFFQDSSCVGECLDQITITKGNYISEIGVVGSGCPATVDNLNIVFRRPDATAIINSTPALSCTVSYIQITISSPDSLTAVVKVYPSGRIQLN